MKRILLSLLVMLIFISHSSAIIIFEEDGFTSEESKKWGKNFKNVCNIGVPIGDESMAFGSGVLISPTSVLTAAHLVRRECKLDGSVVVSFAPEGPSFNLSDPSGVVNEIIVHPDHGEDEKFTCPGVDLAILKLAEPITSLPIVKLYDSKVKENSQAYIVGCGAGGTNKTGAILASHIKRAGTTRIAENNGKYLEFSYMTTNYQEGVYPDTFMKAPGMDKTQALPIEHDSGGGLFFGKPLSGLSVAGIYHGAHIRPLTEKARDIGINPDSTAVVISQWVSLEPHLEWIRKHL